MGFNVAGLKCRFYEAAKILRIESYNNALTLYKG